MATGKEKLITDLFVVAHHCTDVRDRAIIRWVMNYFQTLDPFDRNTYLTNYQPTYPECGSTDEEPNQIIGKKVRIITDNLRLPKGTTCEVIQWISPELDAKNYYIRNIESDYCCWASSQDLQFL